jgi:hypothetical protein
MENIMGWLQRPGVTTSAEKKFLIPFATLMIETPEDWKWATSGKETPNPCLTKDWILGQFSRTRAKGRKNTAAGFFASRWKGKQYRPGPGIVARSRDDYCRSSRNALPSQKGKALYPYVVSPRSLQFRTLSPSAPFLERTI